MTLGNDFAGVVAAVGSGRASGFAIGERVWNVTSRTLTPKDLRLGAAAPVVAG
jgi:NADPH:quinone reductase-like Zn-dependent oxidoreductase